MRGSDTKDSLLKELALKFYKGNHSFRLTSEDVEKMDWDWQESFLAATFNSDLVKQYPISYQFCKLFLKNLICHLEPNHEVHDDIYAQLCRVMKASHEDGFSYRHYIIGKNLSNIVIMKETRNMVVNGTTGLKTWEAALMLSDWALCNKNIFTNKNVLELGSGVGFAGITIGKLCDIKSLLLTDCHDEVLTTIRENIQINFTHLTQKQFNNVTLYSNEFKSIGATMLDWNDVADLRRNVLPVIPDIIIGADIVYDPTILEPLCKALHKFFNINKSLEVYIASVIRNQETFEGFLKSLATFNCQWEKIDLKKSQLIEWDESVQKCLIRIKIKAIH